jgi:predicted RNase H-like nuclease
VVSVGIDWCKRGWVAAVLEDDRDPELRVGANLGKLIEAIPDADCVGVDMPIGLPALAERQCDRCAREFVGKRRNSVFMTPPAEVLRAESYLAANAVARDRLNHGISRQAYALAENIRVVADVAEGDERIIEVHREVSFRAIQGKPLEFAKTTWNGQAIRRSVLAGEGIRLPDVLTAAGDVPVADVLDALAAAWSAQRYARRLAKSLPNGAKPGAREVIWY